VPARPAAAGAAVAAGVDVSAAGALAGRLGFAPGALAPESLAGFRNRARPARPRRAPPPRPRPWQGSGHGRMGGALEAGQHQHVLAQHAWRQARIQCKPALP
jgi:hypothetical protein